MKREVRKRDGKDKGTRGGITGEGGEFITLPPCYASSRRLLEQSKGRGRLQDVCEPLSLCPGAWICESRLVGQQFPGIGHGSHDVRGRC